MDSLFEAGLIVSGDMRDFDEMAAEVESWDQRYHQLGKGAFFGRSTVANSAHIQFARTSFQPGIFIEGCVPQRAYTFVSQVGGAPVHCHGTRLDSGQLHLMQPGEEFVFSASRPCEILVLSVDCELLDRQLQNLADRELDGLSRQYRLQFPDPGGLAQLNRRWSAMLARAQAQPELLKTAELERELLWPLVSAPAATRLGRDAREQSKAHTSAQAAARLISANRHRPVRVAELATHLGVAERTLQQGFRECYGSTPKGFATAMRFNHLRRELLRALDGATVSEVLIRNGFSELGRSAVEYRQMFGESPSATLQARS